MNEIRPTVQALVRDTHYTDGGGKGLWKCVNPSKSWYLPVTKIGRMNTSFIHRSLQNVFGSLSHHSFYSQLYSYSPASIPILAYVHKLKYGDFSNT
jgi:hypothetical protein